MNSGRRGSDSGGVKELTLSPLILTVLCLPFSLSRSLALSLPLSDYPHKYGPEGGCANSSVFEKMKKYQASSVEEEEPFQVNWVAPWGGVLAARDEVLHLRGRESNGSDQTRCFTDSEFGPLKSILMGRTVQHKESISTYRIYS